MSPDEPEGRPHGGITPRAPDPASALVFSVLRVRTPPAAPGMPPALPPGVSLAKRGFDVLRDKTLNRSIAFKRKERNRLGLTGLLPHRVATERQMVERVMENLDRLPRDIDRYMVLSSLQERN